MSNENINSRLFSFYLLFTAFTVFVFFSSPFMSLILNTSPDSFISIIQRDDIHSILIVTLFTSTCSTLLALLLGIAISYLIVFEKNHAMQLLQILIFLPMVLPPSAAGYILLISFGPYGILGKPLLHLFGIQLLFSNIAIIIAQLFVITPFVVNSVINAFKSIPENIIKASFSLGANKVTTFRHIILPLSKDGIITGAVLAFARAVGEFGATVMVAGLSKTVPIKMYSSAMAGHQNIANALALVLVCVSFLFLGIINYIGRKKQ